MAPKERIEDIVERLGSPLAETLGYELVAVEYRKEGSNWVLRCFIDNQDGVGLNECQRYSEELEKLLDKVDPIPGSYLLEVSSPGLDRPLRKDTDYLRFVGANIEITLRKALKGQKVYRGELLGLVTGEIGQMIRMKQKDEMIEIPRAEVAKAHIIAEIFGSEGGKKRK